MIDTPALADAIGARLDGPPRTATHLVAPGVAETGGVAVATDPAALAALLADPDAQRLAAVLVLADAEIGAPHPPLLRHDRPRIALARVSRLLVRESVPAAGTAEGATVASTARLGRDVAIAAGALVGDDAEIGDGCVVDAGVVVGPSCRIGAGTRLFPRAVLYPNVRIGERSRLHAGVVIGADGFGYAAGPDGAEKIHHAGSVRIGDDVEVGANSCIDRGTIMDTTVGDGTKIDNLCQIGHNVRIGRHCLIAGHVAIGGSTVLEDGVVVGGGAAISDHVTVHAGARIAGRAGVSKDVPAGEAWGGTPAIPMRAWARERYLIGRLERIWAHVRATEKRDDG